VKLIIAVGLCRYMREQEAASGYLFYLNLLPGIIGGIIIRVFIGDICCTAAGAAAATQEASRGKNDAKDQ
jgi:hypothetical protein